MSGPIVVKVGGSLYDWPQFLPRLRQWLAQSESECLLLVPGGGAPVEELREEDRIRPMGEETAHWLALRLLSINASFLASNLDRGVVVESLGAGSQAWQRREIPVLDPHAFFGALGECETGLPCSWDVTSDSIAAYVAGRIAARQLILLKSRDDPTHGNWSVASEIGFVDRWFPRVVPPDVAVEVVNLRRWQE